MSLVVSNSRDNAVPDFICGVQTVHDPDDLISYDLTKPNSRSTTIFLKQDFNPGWMTCQ